LPETIEISDEARVSPLPQLTLAAIGDTGRPSMLFLWESFGPHHIDRVQACCTHFAGRYEVYGVEIATFDANYEWRGSIGTDRFLKVVLFPNSLRQKISNVRCFLRIVAACWRLRSKYLFFCNFNEPAVFAAALAMRILGRRLILMNDSKFDDKRRHLLKELAKTLFYLPYNGAIAAGHRSKSYLTFFGFREDRVAIGYDTVSVDRIRSMAAVEPAPGGVSHRKRHFTIVARFVPKKNLGLALDAYAHYCEQHPGTPRELHICGSGELESVLREQSERLGLTGVRFLGYQPEHEVARVLGSSLALILPSVEEQHGLVINEAIAMGVPVLVSDNCGARDLLVRSGINGYVFEPDNAIGLAYLMDRLDGDAEEWARLASGNRQFADLADTKLFVAAVGRSIESLSRRRGNAGPRPGPRVLP
jgi:glycosyltransferase involved in cell wall biosynthesis